MKRYLILSAALVPLFGTSCDKPKPEVTDRLTELEQRVAAAEQEAAAARAAQKETERLLEEQRLAVQRDALERDRIQMEQERTAKERQLEEQARTAVEEIRERENAIAQREQSTTDLQTTLADQQKELDQREAELSERDRELAGREALPNSTAAPDPEPVDVQIFYDSLTPHGSWFDSPDYGYVWRPTVYNTAGWRPYTRGRWACTDRGWMWISDEPFGWATYHYGRWTLCRINGWIWIPGTQWAPSWVCWRSSGSHIGWAPLPPETLAYRGRHWDSSVEVTFGIGSSWFCFVETSNFSLPIHSYCLPYTRNDFYWSNTVNCTNVYFHNNRIISGGPSYGDIARQTKRRPPFYRIEEDRRRYPGTHRGQNHVQNGRVVVTPPRREESRNPDAVLNRPSRINGKFDRVDVVRTKPLEPDIVREFQKNREQSRKSDTATKEITQRGDNKPTDRGEEQRRLNEKAQDLEKEARRNVDDRIRVLPGVAGNGPGGSSEPKGPPDRPSTKPTDRGEEQRRLNEEAQDLEKEARRNVDDRIRILPSVAGNDTKQTRVPNPTKDERPNTTNVSPRREENQNQDAARQQQQRQAEEQERRRGAEEQQRQQQQRQAEENSRRQEAQAEAQRESQREAQREAQRESQREAQRQQQAAESRRQEQQQRQAEESQRQQRQAEENSRRQEQQRQNEEQQRRNRR